MKKYVKKNCSLILLHREINVINIVRNDDSRFQRSRMTLNEYVALLPSEKYLGIILNVKRNVLVGWFGFVTDEKSKRNLRFGLKFLMCNFK